MTTVTLMQIPQPFSSSAILSFLLLTKSVTLWVSYEYCYTVCRKPWILLNSDSNMLWEIHSSIFITLNNQCTQSPLWIHHNNTQLNSTHVAKWLAVTYALSICVNVVLYLDTENYISLIFDIIVILYEDERLDEMSPKSQEQCCLTIH